ncbi:hypothetical protein FNV43_RR22093 [Rhamnella rubrinervis]|uniref:Uncharacterized protein n=1 Tax=Rhamnella rubrinervis TaxID=2594499 RepID=A0A8K0DQW4_9ROSA|nr:hypothetical protein FNV43_RR22093 [Rhamnella rubrinervis]
MKPNQQDDAQDPQNPKETKSPPSSSSPPHRKKTRDLPTLSECHACKFRIDMADGKTKLQTLYSEWRIVLLCKKCFARVESSEICSYCFGAAAASEDCFACCECKRRVHRDCFSEYKGAQSCLGSDEVSVCCMDCWIPKPLASWRGVSKDRNGKRKRRTGLESGNSLSDGGDHEGVLEDVIKDANSVVERKIESATKAREKVVKKAVVAKRAIELATNALGFVVKKDENCAEDSVDDSRLAFELHRAINSSPRRILKKLCTVNLSVLSVPKGLECDRLVRASCSVNESACGRPDSSSSNPDKNVSEPCDLSLKEGEGSCSVKLISFCGDDNGMDFESLSFSKEGESIELNCKKCDAKADCILYKYQRRKKTDRYFFKYSKRKTRLKPVSLQASAS